MNTTKVPADIQAEQRERTALMKGTDRLIADMNTVANFKPLNKAEIYKDCLASVTGSLKAYAEACHGFLCLKGIPFSTCPSDICVKGRAAIDKAMRIITGGSDGSRS